MRITRTVVSCALAALVAGCGSKGSVVVVSVDSATQLSGIANLAITAVAGGTTRSFNTTVPGGAIPPADVIAFDLPPSLSGTFSFHAEAFDGSGQSLGTADGSTQIVKGGRADLQATIGGSVGDGGNDGGDGGSTVITITATPSTKIYELDASTITLTAVDPLGQPVTLSADMMTVPTGATFTANGATATLTWTPDYKAAGSYPIALTATSIDPARSINQMLTITVLNTADVVYNPADGNKPTGVFMAGDFDKDGFGDLVICNAAPFGGAGNYTITVLYGDATGYPLGLPYPAARQKTYTVASATSGGGSAVCAGGDFDHDGFSDVAIGDHLNSDRGMGQSGRMFLAYGVARAASTVTTVELADTAPSMNENLGANVAAFDFNGDGITDFVSVPTQSTNHRPVVWLGNATRANPAQVTSIGTIAEGTNCFSDELLALGDLNGDQKDDIGFFTLGLTTGTGTCQTTGNGTRFIFGTTGSVSTADYYNPTSTQYSWAAHSVLCDVDNDTFADFLVLDNGVRFFYGSSGGLVGQTANMPINESAATPLQPGSGAYNDITCPRNFFGTTPVAVVGNPGPQSGMPSMYTMPGSIDIVTSINRTPKVVKTINDPIAGDTGFGQPTSFFGITTRSVPTDFNGDGKADILVAATNHLWIIYGR